MSEAKRQVIPEGPWIERRRCSHPTRSTPDELDFCFFFVFFKENKHSVAYGHCSRKNLIVWNDDEFGYSLFTLS